MDTYKMFKMTYQVNVFNANYLFPVCLYDTAN